MRPDGIEAPIGPVLGAPRRSRDRAQIAVVAAVAVVVLAAGIGLAGNGFSSPPSSAAPSAVSSTTVGPTAAATPTASPLPPPTPNTGLGCSPVRLGAPPEIRLGVDADDPLAIRGVAPGPGPDESPSQAPAWPVLPVEGALTAPGRPSLYLISEEDACVRYVVADYVPGDPGVSVPFPISFRALNVNPPRSIVPLGRLPSGDWIVRVVAYFSTDTAGQEDASVVERFFRVANADTAGPFPTPLVPPAVPCAGPPVGGISPTLVLSDGAGGLVEGTPDLGAPLIVPPITPVRLGDPIEIRVAGDACAIAWAIRAEQPVDGGVSDIEREDNAANDPFLFAQNRWRLHDLWTGTTVINATIRFSADVVVTNRWHLDVQGGAVPAARIVAPNGAAVDAVHAQCGASWQYESGTGGYEYCTGNSIPPPLIALRVAPETPLRVEVPGWTIVGWGGDCGRLDPSNPDQPYQNVDGCGLGGWWHGVEGPPPSGLPAVPAAFLPRSTGPLVQLYLTVQRGGVTVSFGVWAMIETTS